MNKKFSIITAVVIFLIIAGFALSFYVKNKNDIVTSEISSAKKADVKNLAYTIDGQTFQLVDGRAELDYSLDLASKNKLSIFGEPVYGDLDADGDEDTAVLLVNEPGGSGVFYYAALAIRQNDDSYQATNTLYLGDRIAPQTVEIHDGQAVYNFADRNIGEPMTTEPSLGKSLFIQYDPVSKQISELVRSVTMSEVEAKVIAEKSCIKGGEALGLGTYNANTQTWWFDANLNATRAGCNPACVVSEESKTAEINWRCTGAIEPGVNCPQDAKLCPDGSTVGRGGANCEFIPCP